MECGRGMVDIETPLDLINLVIAASCDRVDIAGITCCWREKKVRLLSLKLASYHSSQIPLPAPLVMAPCAPLSMPPVSAAACNELLTPLKIWF